MQKSGFCKYQSSCNLTGSREKKLISISNKEYMLSPSGFLHQAHTRIPGGFTEAATVAAGSTVFIVSAAKFSPADSTRAEQRIFGQGKQARTPSSSVQQEINKTAKPLNYNPNNQS